MQDQNNKQKILNHILPATALFLLTPFFIALHIYIPNIANFTASLIDIIFIFVPLLAIVAVIVSFILFILTEKIQKYAIAIISATGILFWIQGYIFNWNYGVLTGQQIEWQHHPLRLAIDVFTWIVILGLFIYYAKKIIHYVGFIAILLISIQGFSLAYTYLQADDPPDFHNYTISHAGKMSFSEDKNIVIIMLDAFQSDVFQEIIDNHKEYKDIFQGFTFFRNATAQYSKTYGAVPALLTGKWYENNMPIQEFLNESFQNSISTHLLNKGWTTQLYPLVPRIIGYSENYASNLHKKSEPHTGLASSIPQATLLLDLAYFRASPQPAKPFWLNEYRGRFTSILAYSPRKAHAYNFDKERSELFHPIQRFVYDSITLMNSDSQNPTFKFFHFEIPHAPFNVNEQLEHESLPRGREGFKRHSVAGLEAVRIFMQQLHKKDLYDDTMIFVVGDHGGGEYEPGILEHEDIEVEPGDIPPLHHASGMPLMLVKPFNGTGKLKISDAPASLGDVLPTITRALNIDLSYEGHDLFSLQEDMHRVRRYIFYEFIGWEPAYMPDMKEYKVEGHTWSPASWEATGRVFSPPG